MRESSVMEVQQQFSHKQQTSVQRILIPLFKRQPWYNADFIVTMHVYYNPYYIKNGFSPCQLKENTGIKFDSFSIHTLDRTIVWVAVTQPLYLSNVKSKHKISHDHGHTHRLPH